MATPGGVQPDDSNRVRELDLSDYLKYLSPTFTYKVKKGEPWTQSAMQWFENCRDILTIKMSRLWVSLTKCKTGRTLINNDFVVQKIVAKMNELEKIASDDMAHTDKQAQLIQIKRVFDDLKLRTGADTTHIEDKYFDLVAKTFKNSDEITTFLHTTDHLPHEKFVILTRAVKCILETNDPTDEQLSEARALYMQAHNFAHHEQVQAQLSDLHTFCVKKGYKVYDLAMKTKSEAPTQKQMSALNKIRLQAAIKGNHDALKTYYLQWKEYEPQQIISLFKVFFKEGDFEIFCENIINHLKEQDPPVQPQDIQKWEDIKQNLLRKNNP